MKQVLTAVEAISFQFESSDLGSGSKDDGGAWSVAQKDKKK